MLIRMRKNKKAQSTLEYALIISVAVGALLALNDYMQRGIQGRLKDSTDRVGEQFDPGSFTDTMTRSSSGKTVTSETRVGKSGGMSTAIGSAETFTTDEALDSKW